MRNVLVTGANGEVGHELIPLLGKTSRYKITTLDRKELDPELKKYVNNSITADILDNKALIKLSMMSEIDILIHLAALLSTHAEKDPEQAHDVNVGGTYNLLSMLREKAARENRNKQFIFTSTIAVYGLPNVETKKKAGVVKEGQYLDPITMYGVNKLYCENLGAYYSNYYKLLEGAKPLIDFRSVRFPGLISADTMPTGGTSDYAPEIIHTVASGKDYECYVRPDTKIPFMAMPDAAKALIELTETSQANLSRNVYNIKGFAVSVKEIKDLVKKSFKDAKITHQIDPVRQRIVDTWPEDINDSAARADWGWKPEYDFKKAFDEYLIPKVRNKD